MEFVIEMKYIYLSPDEIIQLSKDLMSNRKNRSSSADISGISSIVSQKVKRTVNAEIGPIFENNIRKTLEIEYNWKCSDIPRHFFYREILFKEKIYIIYQNQNVAGKNFIFKFDPKTKNCLIINKYDNSIIDKITEKKESYYLTIDGKFFNISEPKEIEIDGIFQDSEFEPSSFCQDEIKILYNNVPSLEYKYAIMEVKLNANRLIELINQLKKDYNIMKKIITQNVIFLGFICLNDNDYGEIKKYKFSEICGNFQCLILGVKNGIFSERKLTFPIDWKIVSQFYNFKEEFKKELNDVKKNLNDIKEEIKNISNLLGKKRRRKTKK